MAFFRFGLAAAACGVCFRVPRGHDDTTPELAFPLEYPSSFGLPRNKCGTTQDALPLRACAQSPVLRRDMLPANAGEACSPRQISLSAAVPSWSRNFWRARDKLDITVPIATPFTSEISLYERPSISRSTRTSLNVSGSASSAFLTRSLSARESSLASAFY